MLNKYPILPIAAAALLAASFRCSKDLEVEPYAYDFQVPVAIHPLKKAYTFADTIWIETDVPAKSLFDKKSNALVVADTGKISFGASFNRFGSDVVNPANGFCDVITPNGLNVGRQLSQVGSGYLLRGYGCDKASYRCRIGFKPLIKGTYYLNLLQEQPLENCVSKKTPYNAQVSYAYTTPGLNVDVFEALSDNDKGGKEGSKFHLDRINSGKEFVFRVD